MNRMCKGILALAAAFAVGMAGAAMLVENGEAKASVVLGDVGACGAYGAADFADILRRLTGAEILIGNETRAGRIPIFFTRKSSDCVSWPTDARRAANRVKNDGFAIVATPMAVYVFANEARGLAYAAYEILKRWGGCRWFFPGPEGEYLPKAKTFAIPDGTYVSNPTFPKRFFNFVCYNRGKAEEAFKWQLRNGMMVLGHPGYPNFERFGMFYEVGGHVFSTLLPDELFDGKPECFCLVRGRRLPQSGKVDANGKRVPGPAQANQPCLSNPETLRIMRENLLKLLMRCPLPDQLTIINNDSRQWCECPACVAMAAPSERVNEGKSTRYWTLVNDLLKTARAYLPGLYVQTLGYQDFQAPPPADSPVRPDRNATVPLAVHQRCYAHSMGDESCIVNARFRKMFADWKNAGVKLATYEYTNCMPAQNYRYNPLERIVAEDLRYYAKLGLESYIDEVPPYLAEYNPKRWGPGIVEGMRANWLVHYVQAQFLWDATRDYEDVVDDACRKFYGRAWPAMKQYKARLEHLFTHAGIHFMYGSCGRGLGRLLADDAERTAVLKLLADAEAAAKGDAALERRVADERRWLEGSWLMSVEDFKLRACHVFPVVRATLAVDGDPDGATWKDVPVVAKDFRKRGTLDPAEFKTEVKVAWDEKNVYVGVTCFDPEARKVATRHTTRDSLVWEDNDVELFFAPENLKGAEAHLVVNAAGTVYDALAIGHGGTIGDLSLELKAQVKTRVLDDRWTVTAAIPFSALGVTPKTWSRIPFNIGRVRMSADPAGKTEVSSWNSFFHGPEVFHSLELAPTPPDDPEPKRVEKRISLLEDGNLSKYWYAWTKGVQRRDEDPKGVFKAEGDTLMVSGADMGCVTTREAYRDYRLTLEFRYVDNDVQLNKTAARDGGILYHSTGFDGVFGRGIWMSSFEYNIIQGATGDLIVVGDSRLYPRRYRATGRVDEATRGQSAQHWDLKGTEVKLVDGGRIRRPDVDLNWKNLKTQPLSPNEKPVGEWNRVELVCRGTEAEHYFNGMKVGHYYDLAPAGGRIQLQSEGFGIEYRNIVLSPL